MNLKGTLPTLILEALVKEPSHGYRIAQGIKERSQGVLDFKEGTLYPALHKLENEGVVESAAALLPDHGIRADRVGEEPCGMAESVACSDSHTRGGVSDDGTGQLARAGDSATLQGCGGEGSG